MYPDKQIHVDLDAIVCVVIQSRQVSECRAISMVHHDNFSFAKKISAGHSLQYTVIAGHEGS